MYLRINGIQSGPFTIEDISDLYHDGSLDHRVMSWCQGENRWISLGKRWPLKQTKGGALFGAVVAFISTGVAVFLAENQLTMLPFSMQTGAILWSFVIGLVVVAIFGLYASWQIARSVKNFNLIMVLLTIISGVMGVWSLAAAGLSYPVLQVRQQAPNATVTFDKYQKLIHVEGLLGARLIEQVSDALRLHPGAKGIVLDSPGGLVADALAVAHEVRARGLVAKVDGICASACVAIWAASSQRQMTATSRLGIHRLRFEKSRMPTQLVGAAKAELSGQYNSLLHAARFNETVIKKGSQTPPSEMYWLNPVQVADAGVIFAILDADGTPVPREVAKWLWAERMFGRRDSSGRTMMVAVRKHAPVLVTLNADRIYETIENNDVNGATRAMQLLYSDVKQYALLRASDAVIINWAKAFFATLRGSDGGPSKCMSLSNKSSLPTAEQIDLGNFMSLGVTQLIEATDPSDTVRSLPIKDSPAIRAAVQRTWDDVMARGYPDDTDQWHPVQWCNYRLVYYGYALKLPADQAAQAVLYLEVDK